MAHASDAYPSCYWGEAGTLEALPVYRMTDMQRQTTTHTHNDTGRTCKPGQAIDSNLVLLTVRQQCANHYPTVPRSNTHRAKISN